jgi:hypothetical protein
VFDPQTTALNPTRATRLLLLDGHNSHCSIEFLNLAKSKNIEILCLPPHTTHALQPCDVGVFSPLASHWAAEVEKAFDSGEGVSRQTFLKVYHRARDQTITPQTIQASWRKAGIHPLLEIDALHQASVSRSIILLSSIPVYCLRFQLLVFHSFSLPSIPSLVAPLVISSYISCSSACDYWVLPFSI